MLGGFARRDQRGKGELYLRGLLLDGKRKSMQPMAERLGVLVAVGQLQQRGVLTGSERGGVVRGEGGAFQRLTDQLVLLELQRVVRGGGSGQVESNSPELSRIFLHAKIGDAV